MNIEKDLLKEWGLTHQEKYYTFITSVTFHGQRDPAAFLNQIKTAYKSLSKFVKSDDLCLDVAGMSFGDADVILVWRAKNLDAAKAFADAVLSGDGNVSKSVVCVPYRTFDRTGP